jgi:putative membrane protein
MIDRLSRHISFFAPAAVMSAWGAVMLHAITSGEINRLLNPMFRSYVFIAAILLFVLSFLHLMLYQPTAPAADAKFSRSLWRQIGRWLVLLVPVVAASVFSPSALSSTTLSNRAALNPTSGVTPMPTMSDASKKNVQDALSADPNQPVPMEVTDLITVSHSPEQIKSFTGRQVRTIGFFAAQPGQPQKLVRWLMWCCAADAQPISVELDGNTAGKWKDTQWLEVIGTAQFPSTLGHVTPKIDVISIKPTPEPDEPYLSP